MKKLNDSFRTLVNPLMSSRKVEGKGVEHFLPGLPNEVVLSHVVPKLPWRAFHILSCVSPCWREAIQSREIYNARVRSKSTDSLVALNHNHPDDDSIHAISLYSVRDDSWHLLPKLPFSQRGFPQECQCVAVDGKLYVFGGEGYDDFINSEDSDSGDSNDGQQASQQLDHEFLNDVFGREEYDDFMNSEDSGLGDSDDGQQASQQVDHEFQDGRNVYMLDLVGQKGWKKCANLPEPRRDFACGVLNGKVYVFGGVCPGRWTSFDESCESLVYDPKEDEWVSIAPMTWERSGHHVVAVGDEFWVHGGRFGQKGVSAGAKNFIEVYHPGKDKWEYVEPERCHELERLFTVKGKLFLMTPLGIYRREEPSKNNSWKYLHFISLPDHGFDTDEVEFLATQVVNGELLALISDFRDTRGGLYRSEGFGTEKEEIEVKKVACDFHEEHSWDPHLMCPIEL